MLGLPALAALREHFPGASLELIAPSAVLPLAADLAEVLTPVERAEVAALFVGAEPLPPEVVERYRNLDLAVLWLADPDGELRGLFHRLGGRQILQAPSLPSTPGLHAADHLLATLEPLGIEAGPAIPSVRPRAPEREVAAEVRRRLGVQAGAPLVAIHPGSGGRWKCWPAERFARVAEELAQVGAATVLTQGPADEEYVRAVVAAAREVRLPVVAGLSVEELAAFLESCACYLGNDSGVTHLAAAVGTPVVAVFGPTDPRVWGPRGRRVVVLRGQQECAPCTRETASRCTSRRCLEGVEVGQVLEAVVSILRPVRLTRGELDR